jgi:hypothetical protein
VGRGTSSENEGFLSATFFEDMIGHSGCFGGEGTSTVYQYGVSSLLTVACHIPSLVIIAKCLFVSSPAQGLQCGSPMAISQGGRIVVTISIHRAFQSKVSFRRASGEGANQL